MLDFDWTKCNIQLIDNMDYNEKKDAKRYNIMG